MNKAQLIQQQLEAPFTKIGADGKVYPSHKWRTQAFVGQNALCTAYIDSRQVSSRLNEVLGVDGWESTLIEIQGNGIIEELSIYIENKKITKSDIGTPSNEHKEKGMVSDALKRAAVQFGVGKYLYDLEPVILPIVTANGKRYPSTSKGQPLMTGEQLSSYINQMHPMRNKLSEIYNSMNKENQEKLSKNFKEIWEALTI